MDEHARQRRRAEARRRVRRQRLLVTVGVASMLVLATILIVSGAGGHAGDSKHKVALDRAPSVELPGGGREIFPTHRVIAFYGAPGDVRLGVLGAGPPGQIANRLLSQASAYRFAGRAVIPALELIASVATSSPGADGLYRTRQSAAVVTRYLRAARRVGALLILDLQPGRSDFLTEARAYEPFLRNPDVGLALDPEWQLTPGQTPGRQIGSTDAAAINQVSAFLAGIVTRNRLPQKLLIVHQFTSDMVRQRPQIVFRAGLAITINIDGFGDRPNKIAKYRMLSNTPPSMFNGFKLFYQQDVDLMTPRRVMKLRPQPSLVVYQ